MYSFLVCEYVAIKVSSPKKNHDYSLLLALTTLQESQYIKIVWLFLCAALISTKLSILCGETSEIIS